VSLLAWMAMRCFECHLASGERGASKDGKSPTVGSASRERTRQESNPETSVVPCSQPCLLSLQLTPGTRGVGRSGPMESAASPTRERLRRCGCHCRKGRDATVLAGSDALSHPWGWSTLALSARSWAARVCLAPGGKRAASVAALLPCADERRLALRRAATSVLRMSAPQHRRGAGEADPPLSGFRRHPPPHRQLERRPLSE
jgi:hypothetical protein